MLVTRKKKRRPSATRRRSAASRRRPRKPAAKRKAVKKTAKKKSAKKKTAKKRKPAAKKKAAKKSAKKAKKKVRTKQKRTLRAGPYFYIKCDLDGVIIGATSPDEDLDGTIKNPSDFKLKKIGSVVLVDEITFQKDGEFGPCVWKKITGDGWKCI